MAWFMVDDQLALHPKVCEAGNAAMGLWVRAGAWSMQNLTEGFVPASAVRSLGTPGQVAALVTARLWVKVDGGYSFHEWGTRQLSAEQIAERRRKRAEAGRKGGKASGESRSQAKPEAPTEANASPEPEQNETLVPVPSPVLPGTSLKLVEGGSGGDPNLPAQKAAPGSRGSRLPDSWMPPPETIDEMRHRFPAVDLKTEHEKFVNYWGSQPGAKGRKSNWDMTWRNWIIRAAENAPRNGQSVNGIGKPTQKAMGYQAAAERLIAGMEDHD